MRNYQIKKALAVLKEGLDKVLDDKCHQDIEKLIKDIEQEEKDLFIGDTCNEVHETENDNVQMGNLSHDEESKMKEDNVNIEESKANNKEEQIVL